MDTNSVCDYITVRCPICGKPYQKWSTIGGDQSACPQCRAKGFHNTGFHPFFPNWRPSSADAYDEYCRQASMTSTK